MELDKQRQGYLPKGTAPDSTGCAQRNKHTLFYVALSLSSDKKAIPMLKVSTEKDQMKESKGKGVVF